ncbi:TPA: hypothetical protein SBY71_001476 [Campylobacter coli]|nr:hypothetical protein [Campylobacter coli]
MFHLYQAYNICLNLQQEQWDKNKNLDKKDRSYLKASKMIINKTSLIKARELSYKSVVTQQARINLLVP